MATTPRRRRRPAVWIEQAGQGLVEYALIFVLIVIISILGLTVFGATISGFLSTIGTSV